jgi:hypothetical protein
MPTLDEIKKRNKNPDKERPIAVDEQGNVNIEGKGTKVPTGTFHMATLDEIKKRNEEIKKRNEEIKNLDEKQPIEVDEQGRINTEGKGTKVPTGCFRPASQDQH